MSIVEKLGITPGPWEAKINRLRWFVFADNGNTRICTEQKEMFLLDQTHDRQDKDARLIAAAPEMLDALVEIVSDIEKGLAGDHVSLDTSGVIKLIEKATGRTWNEVKELIDESV